MYRSQSAEPCWFARVVTLARRGRAIAYRELVHQVRLVVGGLTPPGFGSGLPLDLFTALAVLQAGRMWDCWHIDLD